MTSSSMNLNFHQTFAPEREHLGKLLELASDMEPMTKEEIFNRTGIPTGNRSGKVEPHIRYAVYMDLLKVESTQGKYTLQRTSLGEVIWRTDPHLIEGLSQLVCHSNLSRPIFGAPLWHFVFHKVVPSLGRTLNLDTLNQALLVEFKTSKVNLSPLKTCYIGNKSFGSLRIMESNGSRLEFKSLEYRSDLRYAYAFTLLTAWEEQMADRVELTIDEVQEALGWGKPFIWERREVMDSLDSLADLGVLGVNRQLTPVTVIRRSSTREVCAKLFSLLL